MQEAGADMAADKGVLLVKIKFPQKPVGDMQTLFSKLGIADKISSWQPEPLDSITVSPFGPFVINKLIAIPNFLQASPRCFLMFFDSLFGP